MKTAFVRNGWYVAAWDYELGETEVITRTIINEPVVIFRTHDGTVAALEDRCPHRGYPLSMGTREGDSLRCGYHGFKFDCTGACTEIPGKDRVPSAVRAKRYAVVERASWIWIWMGSHELADESLIPAIPGSWSLQDPYWSSAGGLMDYQVYYELLNDNLTDLSHLAYVHAKSIGGAEWAAGPDRLIELDRGVRLERWNFPADTRNVPGRMVADMWTAYDFLVPGIFLLTSAAFPQGSSAKFGFDPPPEQALSQTVTWQAVTPVSATTTRYFFGIGIKPSDAMSDCAPAMALARQAFEEDRVCLEAQQRNLMLTGDHMKLAGHDAAPARFRRILARLAMDKAAGPATAGSARPTQHETKLA